MQRTEAGFHSVCPFGSPTDCPGTGAIGRQRQRSSGLFGPLLRYLL